METEEIENKLSFELPTSPAPDFITNGSARRGKKDEMLNLVFDDRDVNEAGNQDFTTFFKQKHKHIGKRRLKKRRRAGGALWRSEEEEQAPQNGPHLMCNGTMDENSPVIQKRDSSVPAGLVGLPGMEPAKKKMRTDFQELKSSKQETKTGENGVMHVENLVPNGVSSAQTANPPTKASAIDSTNVTANVARMSELWSDLCKMECELTKKISPLNQFIPKVRALQLMKSLQPSLRIFLFPDGYAREEGTPVPFASNSGNPFTNQTPEALQKAHASPRSTKSNILTPSDPADLPRYPYDRSSRDFLRALELGVVPPREDLPELAHCRFYDGCLIADIFDRREGVRGRGIRLLLRPDHCNFIGDMSFLTEGLDLRTAMKVEEGVIMALRSCTDLSSRVVLPTGYRSQVISTAVSPMNLTRLPRKPRRQVNLTSPSLTKSTAALMLIAGADKYRQLVRHRNDAIKIVKKIAERGRKDVANTAPAPLPPVPPKEATMALPGDEMSRRPPYRGHKKLRTLHLIHSGRRARARLEEAKTRAQLTGNDDILKQAISELTAMTAKAKSPVYNVQLIEKSSQGCECVIFRGVHGEKAKDVLKVSVGNREEGNLFVDQFQKLTGLEGYSSLDQKHTEQRGHYQVNGTASGAPVAQMQIRARNEAGRNTLKPAMPTLANGVAAPSLAKVQPNNFHTAGPQKLQTLQAQQAGARAGAAPAAVSPSTTVGLTTPGLTTPGLTTPGLTTAGLTTAGLSTAGLSTAGLPTAGLTTAGLTTAGLTTAGLTGSANGPLVSGGLHATGMNAMGGFDAQNLGQGQANVQAGLTPKLMQHHQQVALLNQQREFQQGKSMNNK